MIEHMMFWRWDETVWMVHHPISFAVALIVIGTALIVSKLRNR